MLHIPLDRSKAVPLARQIGGHLERLIRERHLGPGVKLPATRELARTLGVNRATVALAYDELVAAGWARAHVGQGTFVAETPGRAGGEAGGPPASGVSSSGAAAGAAANPAPIDWSGLLSRSARIIASDDAERRGLLPGALAETVISFAGGMPDSGLFPTDAFRRVLNQVVREDGEALLQYYPTGGYPPLRRYLATYLLRFGLEARPEEILIVNGSQQGFDLIARTFIDPADVVAIEQPTYPRAMQVFRSFGAGLLAVPWDADGPRVDVFERLLERHAPKLFYCQPSAHNPTGMTIGGERAWRLLQVAARHQVPIVEDGFDGSLYYGERPAVPLKAVDRDDLVLYIGTFSKILFPGLRLGWLVAPPPVTERLQAAKQLADLHTSALLQAAVHRFCERRLLDRHAARVAAEYGRRRALLLTALRRRMPVDVAWTDPRGGFSLLLTLPPGWSATALLPRAVERGVAFTPGAAFFLDGGGERTLRLSFSSIAAGRIDEGVRRLADAIKAMAERPAARRIPERAAVPLV
ncbi:MAG: PLP-dependent aminotransferase family protein [Candidatus Rokubacteria bacterium]|nr:PLP-dependent aminotransferase family protein [Candidatus Rokubacteria bacterium]